MRHPMGPTPSSAGATPLHNSKASKPHKAGARCSTASTRKAVSTSCRSGGSQHKRTPQPLHMPAHSPGGSQLCGRRFGGCSSALQQRMSVHPRPLAPGVHLPSLVLRPANSTDGAPRALCHCAAAVDLLRQAHAAHRPPPSATRGSYHNHHSCIAARTDWFHSPREPTLTKMHGATRRAHMPLAAVRSGPELLAAWRKPHTTWTANTTKREVAVCKSVVPARRRLRCEQ